MHASQQAGLKNSLVFRYIGAKAGIMVALLLILGFGGAIGLLAERVGSLHEQALLELADEKARAEAERASIVLENPCKRLVPWPAPWLG